ncbi:MAG: hypothetical protein K2Q26_03625 [Bdellovibrionales bacterium]|nr:hypothetical protein [Bdellovibrionales bacterium]
MDQFEDQPLEEFINYTRRNLLDLLEASYGNTDAWPLIRRRVLQIFGSSGFGRYAVLTSKQKENDMRRGNDEI